MKKYRDVKSLQRRILALVLAFLMVTSTVSGSFTSMAAEIDESQEVETQTAEEQPESEEEQEQQSNVAANLAEVIVSPGQIFADVEDNSKTFQITSTLPEEFDGTVTYVSDDESVATVDEKGEITLLGKSGKCSITVTITRGEETVAHIVDICVLQSQFTRDELCQYTGEVVEKAVTLTCGDTPLVQDTDYTLSYNNNIKATTEDSKAQVIITGTGEYEGYTYTREFDIAEKEIPAESALMNLQMESNVRAAAATELKDINDEVDEIRLEKQTFSYTGVAITPKVSFYDFDSVELADYAKNCDILYENNVDAGQGKITVKGNTEKGYTGEKVKYFTISRLSISSCSVVVDGGTTHIYSGDGQPYEPNFTVTYGGTKLIAGVDYSFSYRNNSDVGQMTIHIEGLKNFKGSLDQVVTLIGDFEKDAEVYIEGYSATFQDDYVTGYSAVYSGKAIKPSVAVSVAGIELEPSTDYVVNYDYDENSNAINHTDAGKNVKILIQGKGTYKDKIIVAAYTIAPKSIAGAGFTFTIGDLKKKVYTGQPITVDVVEEKVSLKRGTTTDLVYGEDQDFVLQYENNINAGTAKVKAVGVNNYAGYISQDFTIEAKSLNDLSGVAIQGISDKTFTGSEITFPEAKVTYQDKNGVTIELSSEDYTLAYNNNVDIGTATVTAVGKRNYKDAIIKTFEVLPKTFEGISFSVGGKTVTCNSTHLQPDGSYVMESGYSVLYDGTEKKPTVSIKEGAKDLPWNGVNFGFRDNINAGKAYVEVTGQKPYTGQTARVYFTIEPKEFGDNITISAIPKQTYTGKQVCPEPVVRDGITVLTKDKDYTLSYTNNISAASVDGSNPPTVVLEGIGNYRGTKTVIFTIGDDLATTTINMNTTNTQETEDSYVVPYLGTNRPKFELKVGNVKVDSSNYDISYLPVQGANSGETIQVTCTGKKGYYGTKVFWYTVKEAELGSFGITNKDDGRDSGFDYIYCNRQISVNLEVKYTIDGNDILLVKDKDYTISGDDLNGNDVKGTVGTHTITLTGIGNYSGTQTVTYKVSKGNISASRYSVASVPDQVYTGYPIKPKVILTDTKTGSQLIEGTDFEVTGYSGNTSIGDGVAKISMVGINNYEGVREVTFNIIQRDIADDTITIAPIENQIYTGRPIEPNGLLAVYYEGNPLSSLDYEVEYSQNTNLGYANITIKGKNNYKGTKTFKNAFKIVGNICDEDKFTIQGVSQDAEFALNDEGEIVTSNITVKYKGQETQVDPSNFTVTPVNCTTPGMGQIKIEGQNGCYGSKTFDVKVTCNLATNKRIKVENIKESYDYTSGQIKPVPVVIYEAINGKVILIEGIDYEVIYGDGTENANKDAGTGTVIIKSMAASNYKSQYAKIFKIVYNLDTAIVTEVDASYDYDGTEVKPIPKVTCKGYTLTKDIDYDVEYASNSIAGEGKVIITPHAGSHTIGRREITFKINKASLAGALITYDGTDQASIDDKDYSAEDIKPAVKVLYKGTLLVAGKDYVVGYENNRNVGLATVKIVGQGNYTGTVTQTFNINPKDIGSEVVAEVSSGDYAGGNPVKPLAYLLFKGQSMTEGEDYTVEFTNNQQVTTEARVTFTGINNFKGTLVKTFEIRATDLGNGSIQISQSEVPYTGNVIPLAAVKNAIEVTCPVGQDSTYTLKDSEFDIACDRTIQNAGTYTIVVSGKNGFCGMLELSITVTPKAMDDTSILVEDIPNQPYADGGAVRPAVVVKDTGMVLVENRDYTILYRNNTTSGKATVVITGIGNYAGSREEYFYIGDSIMGRCEISLQQSRIVYNGTQQTPIINTVTYDGSTPLIQGVDYVIASTDDNGHTYDYTNAGDKVLHIRGNGKYYGEATITYKIYPKVAQPDKIQIVLDIPLNGSGAYEACYSGSAIEPTVHVYDTEISEVVEMDPLDYEVTYDNNVNVGRANVDVKLRRNYVSGTEKIIQFYITKKSIEDARVLLDETRIHYTGGEIKPAVTVITPEGVTIPREVYEVSYQDNVYAGGAKAIVRAKDDSNYSGTISADFIIYASLADEADTTISEIGTQFYTDSMGEIPKPVPEIICGGKKLVIGEDVEVTYNYVDGNKSRGKIFIFSKKEDYYTDAAERYYDIGVDTSVLNIGGYANTYTYTGQSIRPNFVISTPSGEPLTYRPEQITYTNQTATGVVAGDTVNVGKVTAQIPLYLNGQALMVGGKQTAATVTFTIEPKAITSCDIVQLYNDTYTGKQLTPPVTILYNNVELVLGRDYAITYRNNVNPGLASVDVTGCGNYSGKATLHFTIKAANVVNLTAKPASTTSVSLGWTKGAKVSGYQVYSADGKKLYGTTSGKSFTVKKLKAAKKYSFKVRSYVTVGGATTYGAFKTVSTNTKVTSVSVKARSPKKSQAKLTWSTKWSVDGFEIWRSTKSSGKYTKVASIPKNRKSYTDKGLKKGKRYYYKVRAYKKINGKYQYGNYKKVKVTVK